MGGNQKKGVRWLVTAVAVLVLGATGTIFLMQQKALGAKRLEDLPPVIEFTWQPLGRLELKDFRGFLKMRDDYALDFTTYRFRIEELDKTLDLPIDGMIGREYESPVSLSLLSGDPRLAEKDQLNIEISIADDRGQEAVSRHTVLIKRVMVLPQLDYIEVGE
jgi:hypothetical protein